MPKSGPEAITTGPDHNLWFTESNTGKIGRITPSGKFTEFATSDPSSADDYITGTSSVDDIITGTGGNLWFSDSNADSFGEITMTGKVTGYQFIGCGQGVTACQQGLYKMAIGHDGRIWMVDIAGVEKICSSSTNLSINDVQCTPYYTNSSFDAAQFSNPEPGIITGPDHNIWLDDPADNQIVQFTTSKQYDVPGHNRASDITFGPDHRHLWFTLPHAVGRLTP